MKRTLIFAGACAAFALPASLAAAPESNNPKEQTEAKTQDEKDAKEEAKEERKICRRIREVGTRFSEKVCMTKDEWKEQMSGAQDTVREGRDR